MHSCWQTWPSCASGARLRVALQLARMAGLRLTCELWQVAWMAWLHLALQRGVRSALVHHRLVSPFPSCHGPFAWIAWLCMGGFGRLWSIRACCLRFLLATAPWLGWLSFTWLCSLGFGRLRSITTCWLRFLLATAPSTPSPAPTTTSPAVTRFFIFLGFGCCQHGILLLFCQNFSSGCL